MAVTDKKTSWKENSWWRITFLIISAVVGFFVYLCGVPIIEKAIEHEIESPLRQLPATLLTLAVLWWFRTYDTRQQIEKAETQIKRTESQIEKAETQIQHGKLAEGLRLLETEDEAKIIAGTQILIEVSEVTEELGVFDTQIRIAFVNRLQRLPDGVTPTLPMQNKLKRMAPKYNEIPMPAFDKGISIMDQRIPYAKHIFRWLCKHPSVEKCISLREIDFFYSEFFNKNLEMNELVSKSNSNNPSYSVVIEMSDIKRALGSFAEQDD